MSECGKSKKLSVYTIYTIYIYICKLYLNKAGEKNLGLSKYLFYESVGEVNELIMYEKADVLNVTRIMKTLD